MNQEQIEAVREQLQASIDALSEPLDEIALAALDHLAKANEELRAEVEEQARLNGMGAEHELSLRATIDRLTKERDEALRWSLHSGNQAASAVLEKRNLTTRLSALQEAIDEAVRRADRANAEVMPCTIEDVAAVLRPFATQPEPDMCPVCSGDCAGANPPVIFCPMQDRILTKPEVDPLAEAYRTGQLVPVPSVERVARDYWNHLRKKVGLPEEDACPRNRSDIYGPMEFVIAALGGRVVFDGEGE